MAKMTGFIFQDAYLQPLQKLTNEELGALLRALSAYHASGKEPELTGPESMAFDFIRADIDRIEGEYQLKCEKNRCNRQRSSTNADGRGQPSTDADRKRTEKKREENKENEEKEEPEPEKEARAGEDAPADTLIVKVQKELNGLTDTHYQALNDYREELSDGVVSHAIDNAVGAGTRNWGYVQSILARYAREGIRSLGEARASDQRFRDAKKPQGFQDARGFGVKPPVNPWLDELRGEGIL